MRVFGGDLLFLYCLKHVATAECFRPDKTRAVSFLNGFKTEPSYEFIDKIILKINRV